MVHIIQGIGACSLSPMGTEFIYWMLLIISEIVVVGLLVVLVKLGVQYHLRSAHHFCTSTDSFMLSSVVPRTARQ
jgi:hypothetical protein